MRHKRGPCLTLCPSVSSGFITAVTSSIPNHTVESMADCCRGEERNQRLCEGSEVSQGVRSHTRGLRSSSLLLSLTFSEGKVNRATLGSSAGLLGPLLAAGLEEVVELAVLLMGYGTGTRPLSDHVTSLVADRPWGLIVCAAVRVEGVAGQRLGKAKAVLLEEGGLEELVVDEPCDVVGQLLAPQCTALCQVDKDFDVVDETDALISCIQFTLATGEG